MTLQRLVLTFKPGELIVHARYSTQDGPGPNTKARAREVSHLIRTGLEHALEALEEGDATVCGTSGFTTREDILSLPRSVAKLEARDAERAS